MFFLLENEGGLYFGGESNGIIIHGRVRREVSKEDPPPWLIAAVDRRPSRHHRVQRRIGLFQLDRTKPERFDWSGGGWARRG